MNSLQRQLERETIAQHARMLRAIYPELYEYLVHRDELLHRMLLRYPDPADAEAGAVPIDFAELVTEIKSLPPGLDVLRLTDAERSKRPRARSGTVFPQREEFTRD